MIQRDVVVIGGSLAGSACARELVRLGVDAVALERDRFPRHKVCGGFLSPGAVAGLKALDILEDVRRAGAVEVMSARVRAGSADVEIPFERPGLGISRSTLDDIVARCAAVEQGHAVQHVRRSGRGFVVDDVSCRVVIDAAGKLSRFTKRRTEDEFGIQYFEGGGHGPVLDFWFLDDAYGGGVSVDGGRSNFSFLIRKDALRKYTDRPGCLVTGPLAYERVPGDFIAIGDASGMVDPFCGEGMRHALESGILAARVVAAGIRRGARYEEMKWEYEARWQRRWAVRREIGAVLRRWRGWFGPALRVAPAWLVNRIWD
ncbi:MAG TPA: NAD(P)/FAD-dependent oxidoreductase [Terriglobia bacterium]|jgi:flavin-dependent dehydrogenase